MSILKFNEFLRLSPKMTDRDGPESYRTALADLTFNSKPMINMLTMLAEENEQMATQIVQVIEEEIEKAPAQQKLPILYLIDSMIKNLASTLYPQLFIQNIVTLFCRVFEEVDEKTRAAMYKLRQTWMKCIPNNKLFALDVRVQRIDPAWPVTAKAPEGGSIHVNPRFLDPIISTKQPTNQPPHSEITLPDRSPITLPDRSPDEKMKELQAKEEELKRLKLELELAQTRAKLELEKRKYEQKVEEEAARLRAAQEFNADCSGSTPPDFSSLPLPHSTETSQSSTSAASTRPRDPRLARNPDLASTIASRDPRRRNQGPPPQPQQLQPPQTLAAPAQPSVVPPHAPLPVSIPQKLLPNTPTLVGTSLQPLAPPALPFVPAPVPVGKDLGPLADWFTSAGNTQVATTAPIIEPRPVHSEPKHSPTSNRVLNKETTLSTIPLPNNQSNAAAKQGKQPKKPVKPKQEKIVPEKTPAPVKFKINTSEIPSTPPPLLKLHPLVKKKAPKPEFKSLEDSQPTGIKVRKGETSPEAKKADKAVDESGDKEEKPVEKESYKEKKVEKKPDKESDLIPKKTDKKGSASKEKKNSSSHRSLSAERRDHERRDSKDSDRSRSSDDRSRASKECHAAKDRERRSREEKIDHRRSPTRRSTFRGRVLRGRGRVRNYHYRSRSRSASRSHSRSPVKSDKRKAVDQTSSVTPSSSGSDVASSKGTVLTTSSQEKISDVDERASSKRSLEGDDVDITAPQAKKARPVVADDSTTDVSVAGSDSKEEIEKLFSGQDIDYRHQGNAVLQSPAQQRWSKFKENHPEDFTLELERRKSMDEVRRISLEAAGVSGPRHRDFDRELHDVDFRRRGIPRSGLSGLSLLKADIKESIPQALSLEHQEEIMMQAEQELRSGRMSHEEHQNLLRQLGQVFDIQRQQRQTSDRGNLDWKDASRQGDPHLRDLKSSNRIMQDDVDHRRLFDSDFRKSASGRPMDSSRENHADRDLRGSRGEEGDVDFRRSGRRDEPSSYGSPKADFDARDSPRSDFDGRSGHRQDYEPSRDGPRHDYRFGGRADFPRGDRPRVFEARDGAREYGGSPHTDFEDVAHGESRGKRPLLGIAPGVPVDAHHVKGDERGPPADYDQRDPHRRGPRRPDLDGNRPSRSDFRHGPDRSIDYEYDPRGMPRDYDYRGFPRDYEGRGHLRDFDQRGPRRDFEGRGLPREFDERPQKNEYDDRGLSRELEGRLGPMDSYPPNRSEHVPPGDFREPPRPGYEGPFSGPRANFMGSGPRPPRPRMPMQGPGGPRGHMPHPHQDRLARLPDDVPIPGSPMDDPRWSVMRGLLGSEVREEIVIDGKPFEVRMGVERRIKISNVFYDVLVDPIDRGIRINRELVYKFGEPKKDITLGGHVVEIFYHGPHRDIWIDGQQHRLRIDAPPLNMTFDNTVYGFQIDGRDNMILVDRLEKGTLGGPPRPLILNGIPHEISFEPPPRRILIDNQSCELKLDRKIPVIMYNGKPHGIRFEGEPRNIYINDVPYLVPFDRAVKVKIGPRPHFLAFGGPAHEVIVDGRWYEVKFNNIPKNITIGNRICSVRLEPPVPRVKILSEMMEAYDESVLLKSNRPSPLVRTPQQLSPKADMGHPLPLPGVDAIKMGIRQHMDAEATVKPISDQGSIIQSQPLPVTGAAPANVGPQPLAVVCTPQPLGASLPQDGMAVGKPPGSVAETTMMNQSPKPAPSVQQAPEMIHLQGMGIRPPHQQNVRFQGSGAPVGQSPIGGPMQGPRPGPGAMLQPQNVMGNPMLLNMNMMQGLPMMQLPVSVPQILGLPEALIQRMMGPQMGPFTQLQQQPLSTTPFIANPTMPRMVSSAPSPFAGTGPQIGPMGMPQAMVAPQSSVPQTAVQTTMQTSIVTPGSGVPATAPDPTPAAPPAPIFDVKDLFKKLVAAGIINKEKEEPAAGLEPPKAKEGVAEAQPEAVEQKPVLPPIKPKIVIPKKESFHERPPDLSDFQSVKLKKQYGEVVQLLYQGIQCSSCGCRFPMSETEKYRQHLDWHFRANKREKEAAKIASYRKWYYEMNEWILYEELEESEERLRSSVFEEEASTHSTENQASTFPLHIPEGVEVIHNPTATGNEKEDVCLICNDPFEQYWDEEAEDWHLRDAIKVDGKVYHPVCYEDAKEQGSSAGLTPTASVDVTVNPLETQLQHTATAGVTFEEVPAAMEPVVKLEADVKTEAEVSAKEAGPSTPVPGGTLSAGGMAEENVVMSSDSASSVRTEPTVPAPFVSQPVISTDVHAVKTEPSSADTVETTAVVPKTEPVDPSSAGQTCAEIALEEAVSCNTSTAPPAMSPALAKVEDVAVKQEPSTADETT